MARQIAVGVDAVLLHEEVDAGERLRPFGEACERDFIEISEGDERDGTAAVQVRPDARVFDFARAVEDGGYGVHLAADARHGVAPAAGGAEFIEVKGGAVARAVVGEDEPVAVEDAPARGGQADTADGGLVLGADVEMAVAHLNLVEAGG